ncbi:hypothetical protein TrVFT333_001617 [Trichoderma virens FT-333]|nr:hypothetical protein TrVFT333_001617 [Trichoderma virens FT-333]
MISRLSLSGKEYSVCLIIIRMLNRLTDQSEDAEAGTRKSRLAVIISTTSVKSVSGQPRWNVNSLGLTIVEELKHVAKARDLTTHDMRAKLVGIAHQMRYYVRRSEPMFEMRAKINQDKLLKDVATAIKNTNKDVKKVHEVTKSLAGGKRVRRYLST